VNWTVLVFYISVDTGLVLTAVFAEVAWILQELYLPGAWLFPVDSQHIGLFNAKETVLIIGPYKKAVNEVLSYTDQWNGVTAIVLLLG